MSIRKKFDDTWLLEYDMGSLCQVRDCHVKITKELIKHFVWFENSQILVDVDSTRNYLKKMHPIEVWFEDEVEKLRLETARSALRLNLTSSENTAEDKELSDSLADIFYNQTDFYDYKEDNETGNSDFSLEMDVFNLTHLGLTPVIIDRWI